MIKWIKFGLKLITVLWPAIKGILKIWQDPARTWFSKLISTITVIPVILEGIWEILPDSHKPSGPPARR